MVAWINNEPIGCGAITKLDSGTAELKRMFVKPQFRGKGVAICLFSALENIARESGFAKMRLETGTRQPEAIGLYGKNGYVKIPNFGEYVDDPFSVCYEKELFTPSGVEG